MAPAREGRPKGSGKLEPVADFLIAAAEATPDIKDEEVFAKLKADLRKAAARTLPDLRAAIRSAFDSLTPKACRNCLTAAGYDAYDPI